MTTIVTRAGKGSELVIAEVDANFTNLNNDKVETSRQVIAGTGLTGGGTLAADRTIGIAAGGVGTTQLADLGVTTAKVADGAITTAKIAEGAVVTADIANAAVTPAKLSTGAPTWDASGNAAIGMTPSGDALQEIYGANSATIYKNVNTGTGLSDGFYVGMAKGNGTDAYVYNRESGALIFGTANAERGRFDTGGRFIMPNQPAFTAANINSGAKTGLQTFNYIIYNNGGHFNGSTGRFTAPVAGRYFFIYSAFKDAGGGIPTSFELYLNGGTQNLRSYDSHAPNGAYAGMGPVFAVFNMAAGDYVTVVVTAGLVHDNSSQMFSGWLIG